MPCVAPSERDPAGRSLSSQGLLAMGDLGALRRHRQSSRLRIRSADRHAPDRGRTGRGPAPGRPARIQRGHARRRDEPPVRRAGDAGRDRRADRSADGVDLGRLGGGAAGGGDRRASGGPAGVALGRHPDRPSSGRRREAAARRDSRRRRRARGPVGARATVRSQHDR